MTFSTVGGAGRVRSRLRMTAPSPVERTVATWYRVGGMTTGSERTAKLATAVAKFTGRPQATSALLLSAEDEREALRVAIADDRAVLGQPGDLADRFTGAR